MGFAQTPVWTNLKLEVDKLDIDKLNLEQGSPKEEEIKVTGLLKLPPRTSEEEEKAITEELTEAETKYQQDNGKYLLQQVYIGQLSEEEESDTSSDYSGYSYFGYRERTFPY